MNDALRVTVKRVRDLTRAEADALDAAATTPFQTPHYASAFDAAGSTAFVAMADDGAGRAVGHALVLEDALFGFRTWMGLGHPHIADPAASAGFWNALLRASAARGVVSAAWRDLSTARLDADAVAAMRRAASRRGGAATSGLMVTSRIALDADADALWARVDRKHRNAVRRAQRDGVQAGTATGAAADGFAKTFTALSDETWRRSGREGPGAAYYEKLLDAPWAFPYLATDAQGAPAAAAIVTLRQGRATYLHGASTTRAPGASTLLQWTLMQDLKARGATSYDLGGSPIAGSPGDNERTAGIRRFKERFGGDTSTWGICHVKVHPRYYAKARRLLQARARMRQADAQS